MMCLCLLSENLEYIINKSNLNHHFYGLIRLQYKWHESVEIASVTLTEITMIMAVTFHYGKNNECVDITKTLQILECSVKFITLSYYWK